MQEQVPMKHDNLDIKQHRFTINSTVSNHKLTQLDLMFESKY